MLYAIVLFFRLCFWFVVGFAYVAYWTFKLFFWLIGLMIAGVALLIAVSIPLGKAAYLGIRGYLDRRPTA